MPLDKTVELFLGDAGMVIHPLAIKLHMGHGSFVLDRVPWMKEQPITDLINALQQLGTKVSCVEETGFPPMTIHIERLDVGKTSISGKV